jgi:cytochrome P450
VGAVLSDIPYLPGGHGLMGHTAEFRRDRLDIARRVVAEGAPLVRFRSPVANIVIAHDPDVVHEALVEKAAVLEKSEMLRFALYPLAGEGLFTSRGQLWRRQRKLMAPLFVPGQLRAYAADMVACAERAQGGWREGQTIELARETTRITMAIAGKTLFDIDTFDEADELGEALTVALDFTSSMGGSPLGFAHIYVRRHLEALAERAGAGLSDRLLRLAARFEGPIWYPGELGRRMRVAVRTLDERVSRMIEERRASGLDRSDLLTKLLTARDEDDGNAMSDRQVHDEVITLFVAGHETTATGLAWTLYELCRHPEVYDAVEREIDALGHPAGVDDLPRLGLTLRAFKEALRLYPPVYFFGRTAQKDMTLAGVHLPRFTNVVVMPYSLHRRPDAWPTPERFDPSRFLPEAESGRHKLAWIPFGAGPRICIGYQFALMEAPLVLATLMRRFRFESLADEVPEPTATLRPKGGVPMRVRERAS